MTTPPNGRHTDEGRAGILSAILDPRFDVFVTPRYVAGVYRSYLVGSSLMVGFFLMLLIGFHSLIGPYLLTIGILGAPYMWYMSALTTRMMLERVVVQFKIHQEISEVNDGINGHDTARA